MADEDPATIEVDVAIDDSLARTNSTVASSPTSSSDYVTGEADDSSEGKVAPFSLKSVEAALAISNKNATAEELQEMVEKCKKMVLESAECSEERKWLVRRLIELRLRAQEIRESNNASIPVEVTLGHHLVNQTSFIPNSGPVYCDHCGGAIWTMLQRWYLCRDCNFSSHSKCISEIRRICAHVVASETGGYKYTKQICPEKGLSAQGYRCAECRTKITFDSAWIEPRLCDYSGLFYCQRCHWNSGAVIPARLIRNWDAEPRKVCRASAQVLTLLEERPVLQLEQLNPKLFELIPDLTMIKRLREDLQLMKRYLVVCPLADLEGLPWRSGLRTHMIENSANYSMKDLIDLQNGILVEEIRLAYETMRAHITEHCKLCTARGYRCEICGNDEIIFPWDGSAMSCAMCSAVHHRACWAKRNGCCPKCARREKIISLKSLKDDIDEELEADGVEINNTPSNKA